MSDKSIVAAGFAAILLGTMAADSALAQGRGRGGDQSSAPPASTTVVVQFGFGIRDRETITTYYTKRASSLPPGLAKRGGGLPPGLEKQLQRNGTLPPGLRKQVQPVPLALERQLSRLPVGYRRAIVGAHIIVYKPDSHVIVDVMLNVVR
jgi:hypothetical protein